jgi:NAD(P)-dependent dehydrogenase (short-subunit alcohol dehydrogenase family)
VQIEEGQVAVVTGAASGIGLALARGLARRGVFLCLLDVEAQALEAAAEGLQADGAVVLTQAVDVSDAAQVARVAAEVTGRFGAPDLLVNNAGVGGLLGPIWSAPAEDWAWVLGVNLMGVAHGVRAFVPDMLRRGSGHVLNIASLAGLTSPPFLAPYATSKHAVVSLSESLAAELAAVGSGVKVSVACPGNVVSRIHAADRNRPVAYSTAEGADPALLSMIRPVFDKLMQRGMQDADAAAERILVGVQRDAFYILTHPGELDAARDRLAQLEAAFAAA